MKHSVILLLSSIFRLSFCNKHSNRPSILEPIPLTASLSPKCARNMMSRFWQVITALREHSQVSYTKIATLSDYCDVELIIIKATAPNDLPFPEHYIHELLKIFTIPPSSFRAFSLSFTRRFGRTRCWRVALKCLLLLHRLL
jgi:hypothetical protein